MTNSKKWRHDWQEFCKNRKPRLVIQGGATGTRFIFAQLGRAAAIIIIAILVRGRRRAVIVGRRRLGVIRIRILLEFLRTASRDKAAIGGRYNYPIIWGSGRLIHIIVISHGIIIVIAVHISVAGSGILLVIPVPEAILATAGSGEIGIIIGILGIRVWLVIPIPIIAAAGSRVIGIGILGI